MFEKSGAQRLAEALAQAGTYRQHAEEHAAPAGPRFTVDLSRALNRPREETARHIEATDRDRAEFVREHFRRNVADPRNYDLVLNTSRFTVAECADLIIESLRRLESHAVRGEPALAR